jgi:TetR/AcrR family transcriptional repressor of mexJK operon
VDDAPARRGRPRGAAGAQLLDVAREIFLSEGFAGATMADVARRARVSKASLYRDHPSKDALFAAVVADWVERGRDAMRPHVDALLAGDDVRSALETFARVLQRGVLSDQVLGIRRVVSAEADRLPEVARSYVADSWDRNIEILGETFAELMRRGELVEADPMVASRLFTWMTVGEPLNARSLGASPSPESRLSALARDAVDAFAARYLT